MFIKRPHNLVYVMNDQYNYLFFRIKIEIAFAHKHVNTDTE